jgi:MFS family permease
MLLMSQYINARIASDQRATVLSIYALLTALASSVMLPIYGYLADEHSLRFLFGAVAAFGLCALPVTVLLWRRAEAGEEAEARPERLA